MHKHLYDKRLCYKHYLSCLCKQHLKGKPAKERRNI